MSVEASDVLDALARRHDEPRNGNSRAWVYAEEVRVGTGFRNMIDRDQIPVELLVGAEQRIDAFALHTWPSESYRRIAYEVKVSRSDLRRELEQPEKQAAALALSNQFYLVAPTGLNMAGLTLPDEWGVMLYNAGRLKVRTEAPFRDTPLPPYSFMLSLARNLQAVVEAV